MIETLPAYRANQPFTESVRLRRPIRSLQNFHSHRFQTAIHLTRKDAVPIVEDETAGTLPHGHLTKLLQGPVCRGMRRHVEVSDAPGSYLHSDKYIENAKASGHDDEEARYCAIGAGRFAAVNLSMQAFTRN